MKRTKTVFNIKKFIVGLKYEWRFRWNFATKKDNPDQKRILIFGQGRSGSTLLEDLIDSTNQFKKHAEVLNKNNLTLKQSAYDAYKRIAGISRSTKDNFICHVKIEHITKTGSDVNEVLSKLKADGWTILYLVRSNRFKQAISNIVARDRAIYTQFQDSSDDYTVEVDIEEVIKKIRSRLSQEELERVALQGIETIDIVYEKDLVSPELHQKTIDRIFDAIGLPPHQVATKLKKINKRPYEEIVSNYGPLSERVRSEGFGEYLD